MSQDAPSVDGRPGKPSLTVVLIAVHGYGIIERTVAHLRRQTIADRIELVILARCPMLISIPQDVREAFYDVRVIDIGCERRLGALRAEGIRQARAEFVAMSEDHCFPNDVWAESLIAEHDAGADVVGPRMVNCNPNSATSWSAHLIAYQPWIGDGGPRAMNMLPGHNSSYRRAAMLQFGRELDLLMGAEVIAHWALYERGSKLIWQPRAQCRHVSSTDALKLASSMFHHGRTFGAARSRSFSLPRRWLYALSAPLIPALRVHRVRSTLLSEVPRHISRLRVLLGFTLAAFTSAVGETLGMVFGPGRSPLMDWTIELDRRRFIRPQDEYLLWAATPAGNDETVGQAIRNHTEPISIGVIGCGSLARNVHLPLLARRRDVDIVALADCTQAARQAALWHAPSAREYDDAIDLIHDKRVEAVLVCAPTSLHSELAIAALEARKHLYLEKPLAATAIEGERVVAAWRAAGTVAMIGFNYRQHPGYAAIRNAVVSGYIGNIVSVRDTFCTPPGRMTGWREQRHQGGGVLLELASHEIDLVHFVLGEPIVEVTAQISSRESENDTAHVHGRTASGIGVQGFFSFCAVEEAGMEIYGDEGKLAIDRYGQLTVERRGAAAPGPARKLLGALLQWRGIGYMLRRQRSPWREPSFERALARFVEAVRAGTPVSPDLNDGLQSLRVIIAAETAAKLGGVVHVDATEAAPARDLPHLIVSAERAHV
jgi:predicted dehydrogenase